MSHERSRPPSRRGRRRAAWLAGVLAVLSVAAGSAWFVTRGSPPGEADPVAELPPATARVTRQDLAEVRQVNAVLGYGAEQDVPGGLHGVLTWLPADGTVISRGQPLYRVDNRPVVLMYGTLPPYRTLAAGVTPGADVRELEQNLTALGYPELTVDEVYTRATAGAVRRWQADLGLPQTGAVEPGRIWLAAGPLRVTSRAVPVGGRAAPGRPVLGGTGTAPVVTAELAVADRQLARIGTSVRIALPDGRRVPGTVSGIAAVARTARPGSAVRATVEVTITVDNPASTGSLDVAPVQVELVSRRRHGVLTVPVAALLARHDGGYAVELVRAGAVRLVDVRVGMFAGGRVEVSGPDLVEGASVGVPAS